MDYNILFLYSLLEFLKESPTGACLEKKQLNIRRFWLNLVPKKIMFLIYWQ